MRTIIVCTFLLAVSANAATVAVVHNDIGQTGANTAETVITPSNVGHLGVFGRWNVTGYMSAQPLYIPAIGGRNLLIAATWSGNVYAFDADSPGTTIWSRNFPNPRTSYPNNAGEFQFAYGQPLGIVGTPYVDASGGFVYLVVQDTTPQFTLYQLSLSTGATLQSVVIAGSVTGTGDPVGGDCVSGGVLSFCASFEYVQRPGLVVANGNVYVGFGSTDVDPYHGWLFAYAVSNFARVAVWCDTPNTGGGSLWQSGAAPSVDGSGNIYVTTGNGNNWDPTTGSYVQSVVKLSPGLVVADYFTPSNWASLNTNDEDVSANHFTLIPGSHYGFYAAKDYNAYLIDINDMGHLQGGGGTAPQTWLVCTPCEKGKTSGGYGQIYMNGVWYLSTTGNDVFGGVAAGSIYAYTFGGTTFTTTPVATNVNTWPFPGPAQIAGTSNGSGSQIVWAITGASQSFTHTSNGTLRAFSTALVELWNSGVTLGLMAKYAAPTIADGKVFAGTQSGYLIGYRLAGSSTVTGSLKGSSIQ